MGLPETVRVRISSENAGFISVTPVVSQEMPVRDLIELMLGATGKSVDRIQALLRGGALVNGASRFRWSGWEAEAEAIVRLLATFPDPDPGRPFSPGMCVRAVLSGPGVRVEISREAGARKRFLRRRSFWEVLMEITAAGAPEYVEYSYRERADSYRLNVATESAAALRQGASLLNYSSLENRLRQGAVERIDLYVAR